MQTRHGVTAPVQCLLVLAATVLAHAADGRDLGANWSQSGQASYYGNHWIGHRTTSGARFDQSKLTCAHASLPLGTRLLVTADDSGDSVVVTVNDREPRHGHRIIDLSLEAARRLHMLGSGIADVTIAPASGTDILSHDAEQDQEVAEAPDDEQADAPTPSTPHVSHARRDQRHRRRARR